MAGSWTSQLNVSEGMRVGRQWRPPTDPPFVDFRFGLADLAGSRLNNHAAAGPAGTVNGAVGLELPYTALENLIEDKPEYCDKVGRINGAIEVAPSADTDFRGGVAVGLFVLLDKLEAGSEPRGLRARPRLAALGTRSPLVQRLRGLPPVRSSTR